MRNRLSRDEILSGNLVRVIVLLAIPVVVNSFLQTMYNLTDTYWLGKLGTVELAAINLVTPVQNMVINFGSGLTVAASVLISQYVGAKMDEEARSMANQVYVCSILFALACSLVCALLAPNIVEWLGAEGETFQKSKTYLQLVILDMPFLFTVNMYVAFHQAEGDTVRPMFLNFFGICINLVLDPILMLVLHWGVAGAALATVFAKAIPAAYAFVKLHDRKNLIYLELNKLHFEKEKLKKIVSVGLPSAVGGSTMQLGFLLMSKSVFAYGTQAMAAYGIGNKVNGLISLPSNGIGSATSIIVGQNCGAHQIDRAKKGYQMASYLAVAFLFLGGRVLSLNAVSTAIVSIFSQDTEVIVLAADFLSIMAFWCFTNGIHDATRGLFSGSGHTMINMIVDISRLWIFRLGTLYVCQNILQMGVRSIWYSVVISNGIAMVILYLVFLTGSWKKEILQKGEEE